MTLNILWSQLVCDAIPVVCQHGRIIAHHRLGCEAKPDHESQEPYGIGKTGPYNTEGIRAQLALTICDRYSKVKIAPDTNDWDEDAIRLCGKNDV